MAQFRGSIPRRQANPNFTRGAAKPQQANTAAQRPRGTPTNQSLGDVQADGSVFYTYVFPVDGKVTAPGMHVSEIIGEVFVEILFNGERQSRVFVDHGMNEMTDRVVSAGDRIDLIAHSLDSGKPGILRDTVVAFMWSE